MPEEKDVETTNEIDSRYNFAHHQEKAAANDLTTNDQRLSQLSLISQTPVSLSNFIRNHSQPNPNEQTEEQSATLGSTRISTITTNTGTTISSYISEHSADTVSNGNGRPETEPRMALSTRYDYIFLQAGPNLRKCEERERERESSCHLSNLSLVYSQINCV